MPTSFTPVQYVYKEIIEEQIAKASEGKIFFFNDMDQVDSLEGSIVKMEEIPQQGVFIFLRSGSLIRD
ncbi:MAG: hypothetical protein KIT62_01445 [Cyclobacteriaceae bacterium]|nr:hypothetical protein [Cyclobacteriaceae bacterium]